MAGAPDFQRLTATLPKKALAVLGKTPTGTVAAGDSEQYTFYPPSGTQAKVLAAYLNAPAPTGATAGTHNIAVSLATYNITQGTSNFGDPVSFLNGYWPSATNAAQPSAGDSPQSYWLNDVLFDDVTGLVVTYENNTTGGTTSATGRVYNLLVVEEYVG